MYVDSMLGTNTSHLKLVKEENTGQPTSYISDWISVIKTSHGMSNVIEAAFFLFTPGFFSR